MNFRKVDSPKSKTTRLAPTQLNGHRTHPNASVKANKDDNMASELFCTPNYLLMSWTGMPLCSCGIPFTGNFSFGSPPALLLPDVIGQPLRAKMGSCRSLLVPQTHLPICMAAPPVPAFLRFFIPRFIRNAKPWGSNSGNKSVPLLDLVQTIPKPFSQEMCGAPANNARKIPTKYTIVQTSFMYILIPVLCNLISFAFSGSGFIAPGSWRSHVWRRTPPLIPSMLQGWILSDMCFATSGS